MFLVLNLSCHHRSNRREQRKGTGFGFRFVSYGIGARHDVFVSVYLSVYADNVADSLVAPIVLCVANLKCFQMPCMLKLPLFHCPLLFYNEQLLSVLSQADGGAYGPSTKNKKSRCCQTQVVRYSSGLYTITVAEWVSPFDNFLYTNPWSLFSAIYPSFLGSNSRNNHW